MVSKSLLTKLFGLMLEDMISEWTQQKGLRAASRADFQPKFSTIHDLITLIAIIESAQGKDNKIFCCFVDF
jgi:hypothetical protein